MTEFTPRNDAAAPTLDEVAAAAGVSRSTASRALNGGLRVSPTAQAAVDDAALQLGYVPNRAARSLVTRRTDSIALIIPEPDERLLSDAFIGGTLRGVGDALARTDLQLVLLLSRKNETADRIARYLRGGHVDGAVITSHHEGDELERVVAASSIPAVFVGRPFDAPRELIYTDVDNVAGARLAVEHLVARGRTRIAHIAGPQDMTAGVDRIKGWRDALSDHGLPADALAHAQFTTASGETATAELLEAHPEIDAIFAASDTIAVGALRALARAGRSVPGDVSVVGYDDLDAAQASTPPLTTLHNPVVELAATAVEQLMRLIEASQGGSPVTSIVFPPRLVVRGTT
ncbi:LacI family DNA-binding transcriptional regulator [Sanguibacter sp. HDW7]|uniref:LacI family DNA-binding transcriptional regulator n=1 Tax=Sanguibacter sp. HDW7 TaxID=2714931 RepID=UPI00140E5456|nr:LacI family DNA-binding transcriptional regulator [Sanguibacter sp. HDW7]QIK84154.1 LacI family transcriptional regulator [Sanguibacter sp. HDW7]